MKFHYAFLLFFISHISISQTLYLDKVTTVSKKTYTYKKTKKQKLKLDFYKPKRVKEEVPLIIYVHGGGFSGGKRNDENTVAFANKLAERGYAVASISYRLTMQKLGFGCNTSSEDKIEAFNNASEDISYAIDYILKNKRKFKIDSSKIILIGTSAGAEAILNLAYIYDNKILPEDFKFAGIISMAGALISLEKITSKNAIPMQLFHGTDDRLVPYNIAPHHYCNEKDKGYLMLYGSKAIADKLKKIDKSYYLYTIKNGDHSWSGRPMQECFNEIIDFLFYDVLKKENRQAEIEV
ncbi:alpha/beta hydrolase [Polaribacter aestuariivivens]|uniref:Alpha/beta hydrolase n=1 Tax=Polaribacter aestuariivivens TaxID=2304626 RepID=A0A5S3NA02_9FLAO|nr:carboxylesterase family protein [Polaribacter aestuariivivens]TMM31937.1 alpha/beta hydrolase [Polaribacter aestuariivivens]